MFWPLIASDALRELLDAALEVTLTVICPLPLPPCGLTVAKPAPLDAVQGQFAPLVVTPIMPFVTPAVSKGLGIPVVSRLMLQARPCSVIWNGWPAISSVPLRVTVVEFASTL